DIEAFVPAPFRLGKEIPPEQTCRERRADRRTHQQIPSAIGGSLLPSCSRRDTARDFQPCRRLSLPALCKGAVCRSVFIVSLPRFVGGQSLCLELAGNPSCESFAKLRLLGLAAKAN